MSATPPYLHEARTANEPKVHPLVRESFVFVPTVGMRLAPEILVLELMREVFYDRQPEGIKAAQEIDPEKRDGRNSYCLSDEERAVLYALRGRKKERTAATTTHFFAPAYPVLAKAGWLRKSQDLLVRNFLLGGPVAQSLWGEGSGTERGKEKQRALISDIVQALGGRTVPGESKKKIDILAAALNNLEWDGGAEQALTRLHGSTSESTSVMRIGTDELAAQITDDFQSVCALEGKIPRMQWMQVLMTFLRFAPAIWLLAHMRITRHLRQWILDAADGGKIIGQQEVTDRLKNRNRGLLSPTRVPTRSLFDHIEKYIKARVEIDIFLYCLERVRYNDITSKELSVTDGSADQVGVEKLLILAREASNDIRELERFQKVAPGSSIGAFLTREGEQFPAWRNPLKYGQGKNIDEFFRVLLKGKTEDADGGYMLSLVRRGPKRSFLVFPGQLLLKTIVYLAARSVQRQRNEHRLMLQHVEEHFERYGIDFSSAAEAREYLMKELQTLGLLTGSPDAGASVAIANPYPLK